MQIVKTIISIILTITIIGLLYILNMLNYDSSQVNFFNRQKYIQWEEKNDYVRQTHTTSMGPGRQFYTTTLQQYNNHCSTKGLWCNSIVLQKFWASLMWLRHIQFLGANGEALDNPKTISLIQTMTDIDPQNPEYYSMGLLLQPNSDDIDEKSKSEKTKIIEQSILELGKKGISNTCDQKKINAIIALGDAEFYEKVKKYDTKYSNPCRDYRIPYYLAFNFFHQKKDRENAKKYFEIAAFNQDAPTATAEMPSIINNRIGENQVALEVRYHLYQQSKENNFSDTLQQRYLLKAAFSLTLLILDEASKDAEITCKKNLSCLYINENIATQIKKLSQQCRDENSSLCHILLFSLEKKFITPDGILRYPPDPDHFKYLRDDEYQRRRIYKYSEK